ncbi:DUF4092 domain-containing protein (plasmid) [Vibrio campbellii]|nr:DUF4092 domain-containing protein [Vibrio campbellii]
MLTVNPTQEPTLGEHSFKITVSDGSFVVEKIVVITVKYPMVPTDPDLVNYAPQVAKVPTLSTLINTTVTHQIQATDQNGDVLSYTLVNAPTFVTIDNSGLLTVSPTDNDAGNYSFGVSVSDGSLVTNVQVATKITFEAPPLNPDVNRAPVIESVAPISTSVNSPLTVQVNATDANNDVLTYSLVNAPSFVIISQTGLLTVEPTTSLDVGIFNFGVAVSDGVFTADTPVKLTIGEQLFPPTVSTIPYMQVTSGTPYTHQVIASDQNGDLLTYEVTGQSFVTIDSNGLLRIDASVANEGIHEFMVSVSDGHFRTDSKFTVDVILPTASCGAGSTDPECNPDGGFIVPNYRTTLKSSGKVITGEVECNGELLTNGSFSTNGGDTATCSLGSVVLGTFDVPREVPARTAMVQLPTEVFDLSLDLSTIHGDNATKVLETINKCDNEINICLKSIDSFDISDVFTQLSNQVAVDAYLKAKQESATDNVGNAPSSHDNPEIVPTTSGGSNDLNSNFVSSTAESSLSYVPSLDAKVMSKGQLLDDFGRPIVGVSFYSTHSTGTTNEFGEFEYLWGDDIIFGIDTFEFGSVKGNQVSYKLSDVSSSPVIKANIQSLLQRYATIADVVTIEQDVIDVFSEYPNVINELINLSLPNGGTIEGTGFVLPNEFEEQFTQGLTANIDQQLKNPTITRLGNSPVTFSLNDEQYVTNSLKKIFEGVNTFHVFHDNISFYGATGYARGNRTLNISNRAFPVMMARTDINHEIPFGEQQAWTREGKPHIAEYNNIQMPPIPVVSKDNATFNLPFVSVGQIGQGKVVFMGNSMYPSILACPDNYWANDQLVINGTAKTCTTKTDMTGSVLDDNDSMKLFFDNLLTWLTPDYPLGINVATNIVDAHGAKRGDSRGHMYKFFISDKYQFSSVSQISSFSGISALDTPVLILQGYKAKTFGNGQTTSIIADINNPLMDQNDITALIQYVNEGGNIILMEAIEEINPEPIGRLADAAGISVGGGSVVPTSQANCGSGYYCKNPTPNVHVRGQYDMVVYERFPDVEGKPAYTVNPDGTIDWLPPIKMPKLGIPSYQIPKLDAEGNPVIDSTGNPVVISKNARIFVKNEQERQAAIAELQAAFAGVRVCTNSYEFEIDCIETRKGHGVPQYGNYLRSDFDRYPVSQEVVESMVKAANVGQNVEKLMNHEIYYRTRGQQGSRLSITELNTTYDNLSVWMWNDAPYSYDSTVQDELGFKILTEYLNCYTDNTHGGNVSCPVDLKNTLVSNGMIYGEGELAGYMNPSFPLNYQEKPLTRIMLGRSFWDMDIKVDVTKYPNYGSNAVTSSIAQIVTNGKGVHFSAGNNQPTGLWAPQLKDVTVTGGVASTITVMMADDLTGKHQHETNLNRPPRMQKSFAHDGVSTTFKVPYGGLISIKPKEQLSGDGIAIFDFNGVEKAAFWKNGAWINGIGESTAPIAVVDTGSVVYTTAANNLTNTDVNQLAYEWNVFAEHASDFYGRDGVSEEANHRRYTYGDLSGFRHRFTNDVQISIGAAHSGYPVMSSGFNANSTTVNDKPLDSWLIWHEIGHNLASAPFIAAGSTEVTNNLLALYVQHKETGNMHRVNATIQKTPMWLAENPYHAWSLGDAGMRLAMFAQLKVWADTHFNIDKWYTAGDVRPLIYDADQGWNMFKLMHRKARGDVQGDTGINYCDSKATGLGGGDLMMVCSSYVSGYDLTDFFTTWGVGEVSSSTPSGNKLFSGGISPAATAMVASMNLPLPEVSPLSISSLQPISK